VNQVVGYDSCHPDSSDLLLPSVVPLRDIPYQWLVDLMILHIVTFSLRTR